MDDADKDAKENLISFGANIEAAYKASVSDAEKKLVSPPQPPSPIGARAVRNADGSITCEFVDAQANEAFSRILRKIFKNDLFPR